MYLFSFLQQIWPVIRINCLWICHPLDLKVSLKVDFYCDFSVSLKHPLKINLPDLLLFFFFLAHQNEEFSPLDEHIEKLRTERSERAAYLQSRAEQEHSLRLLLNDIYWAIYCDPPIERQSCTYTALPVHLFIPAYILPLMTVEGSCAQPQRVRQIRDSLALGQKRRRIPEPKDIRFQSFLRHGRVWKIVPR